MIHKVPRGKFCKHLSLALACAVAIAMISPNLGATKIGDVYQLDLVGDSSNRQAVVRWASESGASYSVEETDSISGGVWRDVLNGELHCSLDEMSSETVSATNRSKFFRVTQVDVDGPKIGFVSPSLDAVAVPSNSTLSVSLSDMSGVDVDKIVLKLTDSQGKVVSAKPAELSFADGVLTYTPESGFLGGEGEEITIWIQCQDGLGNVSEAMSTITIAIPLRVVARYMLCVGDPDSESRTYSYADGVKTAKPNILLTGIDETHLTLKGGTTSDFCVGQIVASMIATNMFRRKVVSISELPNKDICLVTVEAELDEMYSGSFSTASQSTQVLMSVSPSKQRLLAKYVDSGLRSFGPYVLNKEGTLEASAFDFKGTLGASLGVEVMGSYELKGVISTPSESDFELFLQIEVTATEVGTIGLSTTLLNIDKKVKRYCFDIPDIVIAPGVSINIVPSMYSRLKINANASFECKFGFEQGLSVCIHRRYRKGSWVCNDDEWCAPWADKRDTTLTASAEFSAELMVGPRLDIKVDRIVGPYVTAGPYFDCHATRLATMGNGGVKLGKQVSAGLMLDAGINAIFVGDKPLWTGKRRVILYEEYEVKTAPVFQSFPEGQCVKVGSPVTLTADVIGDGPITYQWYKDGVRMPLRVSSECSFDATEISAGTYTCRAINPYGYSEESVQLDVSEETTLDQFVGIWRQKEATGLYREFHITESGGGYFQLTVDGRKCHSTSDFPLSCSVCGDRTLAVCRHNIANSAGDTMFYIKLLGDGVGRLSKAAGEIYGSHSIRLTNRNP